MAIEQALLDAGGSRLLKEVSNIMFEEFGCSIPDSLYNPDYLNKVLKKLFGNSYTAILQSIRKNLDEFSYQEPIAEFLQAVGA
ncbi:MAG TPA: hypothetical protein VLB45_00310 [Nitrosopumilaceae archaeon]|nr:hypothetical protein [Nitrosopumilaceae archaeon]